MYIVSCCVFLFLSCAWQALLQNLCLFNVQGATWWLRSLHEEYSAVSACKQLSYICIMQSKERMDNRIVDVFHCCVVSVWPQLTLYDVWNDFGCFSVSLAPLSTYPLLRTIDKVTSIHPHIWISFSLVSMVNNRTKGLGWMEAGRTMQKHLCCLHTLFENLFCLGIKNLWQLWRSYNSFSATKRLKPQKGWNCI